MAEGRTDLSDYTVVVATREQLVQHAKIAFVHWHHNKPFQAFLDGTLKEHDKCDWGKDGRHEVWALVKRDDLTGEVYAGCEVYRRNALIRRKGKGEVEDAWMYAIASVVTATNHFRKGLATHLLRLLHYVLADPAYIPPFPTQWGPPPPMLLNKQEIEDRHLCNGVGSILFSDVGYGFYEKCTIGLSRPGWKVRLEENTELIWDLRAPGPSPSPTSSVAATLDWTWITEEDYPEAQREIARQVRVDLGKGEAEKTVWQCDPASPGVLTWLAERGPWLGSTQPSSPPPLGLRLVNPDGKETIVLFTAYNEHVGSRLLITHIANLLPEHIPSLLVKLDEAGAQAGRREGWIWGLRGDNPLVRAWNEDSGRNVRVGSRKEFDGHLLGVAWYGPEGEEAELVDRQIWHWC